MKKIKYVLLILLSFVFLLTSCNKEKVITEEEEPILEKINVGYTATEYRLPIMEGYRDFEILKANNNKLYILVDYLDNEIKDDPWKQNAHKNLIIYNFQNEEIIQNIELDEFIEVKDIAVDTGTILIVYKDLSIYKQNIDDENNEIEISEEISIEDSLQNEKPTDSYENVNTPYSDGEKINEFENAIEKYTINIAKFNDSNLEIIDTIHTNSIIPKFVTVNDIIYYSFEENGKYGIKTIKNGVPIEFYKFKDELIGNIYSNNRNLFALVKKGDNAYYYSIAIDGKVKEFYIEVREELSAYEFLKNGIISSYLDINNNEIPKLMYINLNNSKKKIFEKNIITSFVSNNTNNCLMIDTASNLEYLYVKDNELFISEIIGYSGNNFKFYENESKRYGIRDLNRKYIYTDIYFE